MFLLQTGSFCADRGGRGVRSVGRFPSGAIYERNSIWIYDTTHFKRCPATAVITVMDLVTRKWICEIVSVEETSTQVQVAFTQALELEGLLDESTPAWSATPIAASMLQLQFSSRSCWPSATTGRR